jgi:hypothetical protein
MVPEPPSAITTLLHADIVTVTVLLLFGDSPSLLDTVLVDTVLYIVGLIEFLPSVTYFRFKRIDMISTIISKSISYLFYLN